MGWLSPVRRSSSLVLCIGVSLSFYHSITFILISFFHSPVFCCVVPHFFGTVALSPCLLTGLVIFYRSFCHSLISVACSPYHAQSPAHWLSRMLMLDHLLTGCLWCSVIYSVAVSNAHFQSPALSGALSCSFTHMFCYSLVLSHVLPLLLVDAWILLPAHLLCHLLSVPLQLSVCMSVSVLVMQCKFSCFLSATWKEVVLFAIMTLLFAGSSLQYPSLVTEKRVGKFLMLLFKAEALLCHFLTMFI